MKKQEFLDIIASEDELTTSPKQMKYLLILSWTQVHKPVCSQKPQCCHWKERQSLLGNS